MNKKAVELSMNTIIIATICLIVLVVLIAVFRTQVGNVVKSFTGISEEGGKRADETIWDLDQLFGCKEGNTKCRGNTICQCIDDKWNCEIGKTSEIKDCKEENKKCDQDSKEKAICK